MSGNFYVGQFFGGGFFGAISSAAEGRGNWKLDKKRKRPKVIRFSDFDSREAIAKALKVEIAPNIVIIEPPSPLGENDDDAILLAVVSRLLH